MTDDELALFLTKVAAIYYDRRLLRLTPVVMAETMRELDSYNLLSLQALGAIVGADHAAAVRAVGRKPERPRGKLNPSHIPYLGYLLSQRRTNQILVGLMLNNGTSLSTIADLTNISKATLYRWRMM